MAGHLQSASSAAIGSMLAPLVGGVQAGAELGELCAVTAHGPGGRCKCGRNKADFHREALQPRLVVRRTGAPSKHLQRQVAGTPRRPVVDPL
jgi:hypothetical protein